MNPSPETVAALLIVVAALSVTLSTTAVSPRTDHLLDLELDPVDEGERPQRRSGRRAAERSSTPVPARKPGPARAAAPAAPEPAAVVTAYYRALDARRFELAWERLTTPVRTSFGGFEHWRTGYATTVASRPHGIAVQRDGSVASIAHELATEDRSPCGSVRRSFAVRWRLVLGTGGWRAASLTAVKRSGPEPGIACAARHDALRGAGGR